MNPAKKRVFLFLLSICLFTSALLAQPANNNCANATLIISDFACVMGTNQLVAKTAQPTITVNIDLNKIPKS